VHDSYTHSDMGHLYVRIQLQGMGLESTLQVQDSNVDFLRPWALQLYNIGPFWCALTKVK